MLQRCIFGLLLVFVLGLSCIAQQVQVKPVPIKNVDATSGEKMYMAYCASCHGADGKGLGPAAPAMKTPPTDLTMLAKRNNGRYPDMRVANAIYGDSNLPVAHGSKDMPVWGSLFLNLGAHDSPAGVLQRCKNLTDYVQTLQEH